MTTLKRKLGNIISGFVLILALVVMQIPSQPTVAASDFLMNESTLVKYSGTGASVSISNGVKVIGEEAFYDCDTVEYVRIPSSVKEIAYNAFAECDNLKEVIVPDSVEIIGNSAFANCASLKKFTLGAGVETLGNGVFAGCSNLTDFVIAKGNGSFVLSDATIYNSKKTICYEMLPTRAAEKYTMPGSVENIKPYAFWNVTNLKDVTLGAKLQEIPAYAFSNCKNLESVTIPYSVNRIGLKAFSDCVHLGETSVPLSVNDIHSTAFDGCYNLKIIAEEGSVAEEFYENFLKNRQTEYETTGYQEIYVGDSTVSGSEDFSVTDYPSNVHYKIDTDGDGVLGATTRIYGDKAIIYVDNTDYDLRNGAYEIKMENLLGQESYTQTDTLGDTEDKEQQLSEAYAIEESPEKGFSLPKYTIVNNEKIAEQAFYRDQDLTSYSIPITIKEIGEFAFARSALQKIIIPDGVEKIGYGAFYHCDNLEEVYIPSSVTQIDSQAFENTPYLTNWRKSRDGNFLIVGDGVLLAYQGDFDTVTIPEGIKTIAANAFCDHRELVTLYLPDSLKNINEEAFMGCSNLKYISGGAYLENIGDRAFYGCPIKTIRIPDTVKTVGLGAYSFTNTDKKNYEKTVVFHGTSFPSVTVGENSKRLSNNQNRIPAFSDVLFAVVDEKISNQTIEESPLFSGKNGFKGIVVSINSKNEEYVICRYCNLSSDEIRNLDIPGAVVIYGDEYKLLNLQDVLATSSSSNQSMDVRDELVIKSDKDAKNQVLSAVLEGNDDAYYLQVSNVTDENKKDITAAYQVLYHEKLPENTVIFDLQLVDYKTDTCVTKLGKRSITLTCKVPDGIEGDKIHIITVDSDGQLEMLPSQYHEELNTISFQTNHFSPYAFYSLEEEVTKNVSGKVNGELTKSSKKDASPDTGDGIEPKFIFAIGLLFTALAVFFATRKETMYKL